MPGPRSDPALLRLAARLFAGARGLVLCGILLVLLAGVSLAQTATDPMPKWNALAERGEALLADPDTTTEALDDLRAELVAQRAETVAAEQAGQPEVKELTQRLEALGPAPAEGAAEAPEIAKLRRDLNEQIANAQAPVLAAQEAFRRTDTLIGGIDRKIRARFSAELATRGPTPLAPGVWIQALGELDARAKAWVEVFQAQLADPNRRERSLWLLPINLALLVGGVAVALTVRRQVIDWVELRLAKNPTQRWTAWLVTVRNLARLVVPAVAAGLFFAAFEPTGVLARGGEGRFFTLPPFVLVLIATGWLAGSLLAPKYKVFRLVPLEDAEARKANVLVFTLGGVVALAYLVSSAVPRWDLSAGTQTALMFPLVLVGATGLWRVGRWIEIGRARLAERPRKPDDSGTLMIGRRVLRILAQLVRVVAIVAPLIALAGYLPAASFLVFRSIVTLGLIGGAYVIFDLLNKTGQIAFANPKAHASDDGGLVPVVMGTIVVLAVLPLLAMTWGARASDIADFWSKAQQGVTFGGIRLSASALLTLIIVFLLGSSITRLIQTLLRGTVLPRTRLDAGGRSAVVAGVGYVGFAVSGLVAVAAAGLNLSSLAIVAGALSVGIGFGMQNIVSNFVSGIILLVERPVKEGDWIEVGGFSGYVRGINVRSTEIETFDRASVILPNSDLIAGTVLNRTHSGLSGRLQVPVSVTYDSDPKQVETILKEIADNHPLVLLDPPPRVLFLNLGADSMDFELRCWLRDVNFSLSVRSDMNYEIIRRFRDTGIRIQFYGRDLPAAPEPAPVEPATIGPPAAVPFEPPGAAVKPS